MSEGRTYFRLSKKLFLLFFVFALIGVLLLVKPGFFFAASPKSSPIAEKHVEPPNAPIKDSPFGTDYTAFADEVRSASFPNMPYWDEWEPNNSLVYGAIQNVFITQRQITFKLDLPADKGLNLNPHRAVIDCPISNTIVINAKDFSFIEGGVDFFERAPAASSLHAYCLDEGCLKLGGWCALGI